MGRGKRFTLIGFRRRESGSQLVEFALVVPMLLFVMFAIIQYALFFWGYVTIRTASAIGARQAIISPGNTNLIQSAAKGAIDAPPLLLSNSATVTVDASTVNGTLVTSVRVQYPFRVFIPWVVPPFTGAGSSTKTITATTVVQ